MKFAIWIIFIALLIAFASAGIIPEEEYLPPIVVEEEPIAAEQPLEESAALAKDGYRYKTVRKLRHRRDVSELFEQGALAEDGYHYQAPSAKVAQEYLPPVEASAEIEESSEAPQISHIYLPPTVEPITEKKSPEVSKEYLPPTEAAATLDLPKFAANEELPSLDDDGVIVEGPEEATVLADDGYHYRRIRYRRDVSEIAPAATGYSYQAPVGDAAEVKNTYIPPAEVKEAIAEPSNEEDEVIKEYLPPVEEIKSNPEAPSETAELAEDGYRYKTIRKLKYRQRRDVAEIISSENKDQETTETTIEYLPPVAEVKEVSEEPSDTAELAEDGYRYKTIRKLKYRQRRDVSEILNGESAVLADDGYHYKVPEPSKVISKVSSEYLPPFDKLQELPEEPQDVKSTETPVVIESTTVVTKSTPLVTETPSTTVAPAVSIEYLPPSEEVSAIKGASSTTPIPDVSNDYLPPVKEIAEVKEAPETPEETAVLSDDGYHYKVGKRFRFRRDVSEITTPSNGYDYAAPTATDEAANIYLPPVNLKEAAESTTPLVSSEYLPPVEKTKDDAEIVDIPQESAVLADDGYRYKTVRRLKYRIRRDASEIAAPNGYLYAAPAAEEKSAVLADDGYRYKTIRRLKYRHRRDVSELVPQVEESAVLAEDGYHYKTPSAVVKTSTEYLPPVQDVAEVKEDLVFQPSIAPQVEIQYLPPTEEAAPKEASPSVVSSQYLPPVEQTQENAEIVELPQESTVLADDGYHYKTVRRIRYRHRRDVSEIVSPKSEGYSYEAPIEVEPQEVQYLPPVEEVAQVKETSDAAALTDDGYRYKTVRRIRYRHRV